MAFEQSFLLALLLLVVGSGFSRATLPPRWAPFTRARGGPPHPRLPHFSTAINFGAVAGPLFCGLLAQVYGWHYGFGVAAIFMLAGLATYISGYRHLPARVPRRTHEGGGLDGRRLACHPGARRGDGHHGLPVGRVLPARQRVTGLDPGACGTAR